MKTAKIIVAALVVLALLVAVPVAAMAAIWIAPVGADVPNNDRLRVEGPDRVAPGGTGSYTLYHLYDGTPLESSTAQSGPETSVVYVSRDYPHLVVWNITSTVASGTAITNQDGYGVLTVAPDETAATITIVADVVSPYELHATLIPVEFVVYVDSAPAGNGAESEFWYGVHAQMVPLNAGESLTVETTNEDGHIPYFIFQLMLDTELTLTVHRGFDTFVLTSAFVKELNPLAYSLSFTQSLAAMLTPTTNDRGGFTYR